MAEKEAALEVEGTVTQALANTRFRVTVAGGHEVIAHVADHDAFVAKLFRMLRPGGVLMMASQNRPVLERYNNVPPPAEGQLRRWFDRDELRALLSRYFDVQELFAITPRADKGAPRLLLGHTARKFIRRVPGRLIERALAPEFDGALPEGASRRIRRA